MKTKMKIAIVFCFISIINFAQQEMKPKVKLRGNDFALGYALNQFGKDFGIGLSATSPFIGGRMAFRVSENYQWRESFDGDITTWKGYHNVKVGVLSVGTIICDQIRLYGEGGATIVIVDKNLSAQQTTIGGYGLFGFEFFMDKIEKAPLSYYIELGGIGTGAVAEKINTKPILSNGFLITTGFRIYL